MLKAFFAWLGAPQNKDHKLVSALADCMRFMVLAIVAGAVMSIGASDFGGGETLNSSILGALGLLGAKMLKG